MLYRPVSTRPDWLKAWRNEAQYLLYLARRAVTADDEELVQELEEQAREMADVVLRCADPYLGSNMRIITIASEGERPYIFLNNRILVRGDP